MSTWLPASSSPPSDAIAGTESNTPTASPTLNADQELQRWRFWFVAMVMLLLSSAIVARLVSYHVLLWGAGDSSGYLAGGPPARGVIVDRKGTLLAGDHYLYEVSATANALTAANDRSEVARQLEALIGLPAASTRLALEENADKAFVQLAKRIPFEQGERILAYQAQLAKEYEIFPLQQVFVTPVPIRYYPQGALASHILGFVNAERVGNYGLESYYDAWLLERGGADFTTQPQHDLGVLPASVRRFVPSSADKDLVLTLDATIQWIVEDELQKAIEKYKALRGTIIVIEPKTGAILGMASWPKFDPNNYGSEQISSFLDPAISEQYEPGSVFKIITNAAGVDTGVITPTMVFTDSGTITVGGRVIFNSQRIGYGRITAVDAFARSLNVVTAQIAAKVGAKTFYEYVRRFGFGSATEVDLGGEVQGALKSPGNEEWSLSDLGTNSFGQGLAATPLQMVNAVASIANHGKLMRPYVVQERVHRGKVLVTEPTVIHTTMRPENAATLTEMMVQVVNIGNPLAAVDGYAIAGKSGTAQIPTRGGYLEDAVNATFVGFAPADDPRFAIIVKLEQPDPKITQWASYNAGPTFAQVAQRLFEYLNIPPDAIRLGGVAAQTD